MKVKSIILAAFLALALWPKPAFAERVFGDVEVTEAGSTFVDIFRQNKDQILDWAIASSLEGVFYYGSGGRKSAGGQIPLVFLGKGAISGDLGYVTMTDGPSTVDSPDGKSRGNLAVGASIRVNRILELYFPDTADKIRNFNETTSNAWSSLFFGPGYSYLTTEEEHVFWFKCGIKIF